MRFFEAWRQFAILLRERNAACDRMAFQAGARHALNELIEHLDGSEEATAAALCLNDEIHSFATVALLDR